MKTVYTLLILAVLFGLGGFIQGVALNGQVFMSIVLAIAAIIYGNIINREEVNTQLEQDN